MWRVSADPEPGSPRTRRSWYVLPTAGRRAAWRNVPGPPTARLDYARTRSARHDPSFNPGYSGIIRDDPGMRLSRSQRLTCVILYLYGYSHFERYGVMPFGELKHGAEGLREDLASLFGRERRRVRPTDRDEKATRQQAGMSVRQRAAPGPMSPPADQHAPRTARAPVVLDYLRY